MSKFWMIVTFLLGIGLLLNFTADNNQKINFSDLETECRYDRGTTTDVSLENKRLHFSGNFPIENPTTSISHTYKQSNNKITLDITTSNQLQLLSFINNCKATAIYDGSTDKIRPGTYLVTVKHDGKQAYKSVIEIR